MSSIVERGKDFVKKLELDNVALAYRGIIKILTTHNWRGNSEYGVYEDKDGRKFVRTEVPPDNNNQNA